MDSEFPQDQEPTTGLAPAPVRPLIRAADPNQVMAEQLESLIDHAAAGLCGCEDCERYALARALLMEPFRVRMFDGYKVTGRAGRRSQQ